MSLLVQNTGSWTENLLLQKGQGRENGLKEDFLGIYDEDKALYENKGRRCGQDYGINYSILLGVPISQETLYKQSHYKIKVDTRFVDILHELCVAHKLKFENDIFDIL